MAIIQATSSFDIDNINLYRTTSLSTHWIFPSSGNPVYFQDNGMQSYGYWFDDALEVLYDYAGSSYELALGGNGLTWNGTNLTGGTVVAMIELSLNSSGVAQTVWTARDFSLAATSFSAARLSSSNADDYTLVQSMLSGGDQMLGSTSNDRFRGYGGSDSIDGSGGSDTAIYSGKFSDYSFAFNKSTLATTITDLVAGRDGVDSLQNIESLQFSDVTVNLTSYQTDTIGPYAVSYSPVGGSSNVAVSSDFVITFNEPILRGTGSIALINTATGATVYSIAASSSELTLSGNTLTINPAMDLSAGTSFSVLASSDFVRDIAANSSTPGSSYLFSTAGSISGTASNYESEPNGTIATADPVNSGILMSAQLSSYSDDDYFSIVAGSSGLLNISFTEPVGNYSSYTITAYNSGGAVLASWDTSDSATYQVSAPTIGTYYVAVDSSYSTGQYGLTLSAAATSVSNYESEPNGTIATADPVNSGILMSAQLSSYSDDDYFSIVAGSSGLLNISFTEPVGNYSSYTITAYNSGGAVLASWDTSDSATYQVSAPTIGTYYVAVDSSYSTGQYGLTLSAAATSVSNYESEPNGTIATADPVNSGILMSAQLSSYSDDDYFSIVAGSSGLLNISFTEPVGNYSSYTITAYNSGGAVLASWDTSDSATYQVSAPTIGTYYVAVDSSYSTGQYGLTLSAPLVAPTVSFSTTTASINEGNSGTQNVTATASLSSAAATAVTVSITVSGTATAGTDYTGAPASITIAAGSTTGSASFNIVGDTTVESNETVVLTMGTPTGATLGTNTTFTQTIVNDDVALPTVSFSTTTASINEGNSGTQNVTATASLSSAAATAVTVPITYSGSALFGSTNFVSTPNYEILGRSGEVALSKNGLYVVQGLSGQISIQNLDTHTTQLYSLPGANPYGNYSPVAISDDGNSVFIRTWNGFFNNSGAGTLQEINIASNTISRVDVNSSGLTFTYQGWSLGSGDIDVSPNGRHVVFAERDLINQNNFSDGQKVNIYYKDTDTGALQQVDSSASSVAGSSSNPRISDDGRFVLFQSSYELTADDIADGLESSSDDDLFIKDLQLGTTARVNLDSSGHRFNTGGYGWNADLSGDGKQITFVAGGSYQKVGSPDGLPDSNDGTADVFVKHLDTGNIERISGSQNGGIYPQFSPDGNYVAYQPYVYQNAIQTEVVNLQTGVIWRAPGTPYVSTGNFSSESIISFGNNRGILWSWNNYPGDTDSGDADYIAFTYSTNQAGDYTGAPASITIAAGSTTGSASFNVVGDTTVESNETVVLTMGTPTGATLGTNTTFTQTIVNDDVALPTVSFSTTTASINEGNSGTQNVTATASLSSAAATAVTVPITVSGTATAGTDYTGAPASITIAAGSTTGSASFNIVGDTTVESNETVVLTMGTPTGATLGTNTTFTQTIVNDDVATNSYSPGQSIIDLGSYGKLIAPVQVDGGNWYYFWDRSGDGTSTDGVNGVADKTTHDVLDAIFNRDALGNLGSGNTTDGYRYATLNGVQLALPTSGTTTGIDTFKNGTSISGGSSAVNSTYNDLLAVWDAFNGSGTGSTSNGAAGTPTGWAAIANNNGSHYWSATPQGTADYHSTVTLWSGYYGGGPDTLSFNVALQVLPLALTPTVSFNTTTASINEGNSGTQTVTATASLSSAATTAVTVPITYSGTATAGTDYTGEPSSITIAAGSTTGSASFNIVGDTTVESNETVVLTMGTPTGATLGANTTFIQTIVDDDNGGPTYSLSANLASIYEGGGGDGSAVYYMGPQAPAAPLSQITFTIATTNVAANTPLTYALSGAGITSADLGGAALAGTVLVGTDGRATITVNPTRDFSAEGIETLMATVQGQSASVQINDYAPAYRLQAFSMGGVPSISGIGRLSDNASIPLAPDNTDYANYLRWLADGNTPYAAVAPNSWSVDEGGAASFTVLTQNVAANTVFNYTLSGSAISASDIVGGVMSGPVTIGSDGKGSFTVNIASDLSTEGPETLTASIGANSNAAYVTINDSSTRPLPTYSLSASAGSFNEGSAVTFSLVTTNVDANTILTYNLSGSGISVNDFVIPSLTGNVTIDQYGLGSFTVNLANDLMTEGSEILSASVQGQSTSVFVMDTSVAAPVLPTVSFATTTASTNEGNSGSQSVTVNASLSSAAITAITVPITYSGSATVGTDYTAGSGTITFAAGSSTASTSFSVVGDIYDESNETVVLTMGTPTGATLGANSTYTHTILNDDVTLATTSGRVIDGYVAGAKVFSDLDGDLALDWTDTNGNAIYDNGEGEPWAVTDVHGVYSFTSSANISNAKIVSIGGTDVSTHAAMDLLLAAPGSNYITPISTIYAYAEAQGPGKGAAVLSSLGLSTADLSYDPVASLASNPNAAQVLKIGVSLLTVVNNASALVTELSPSAVSHSTAAANVFAQIANLDNFSLSNLVSAGPAFASVAVNNLLNASLSMQGVNIANYSSLIAATAQSVANVTSQVQSLTSVEVQAGAQNALGALGQTTLADHIQTIADLASSGSALAATQIASLGTTYAAGNIDNLVIAEELKLASAPTISLAAHVDPTTGAITVDAGWTGSLESINYSVRAIGASYSASTTDTLPGDWSAVEGYDNIGQSSQFNIGVIGSSPNSITGDGTFSQTTFMANGGVRDVTISMLDVAVDPVGDGSDLPVEIPAAVTLAMGATLSVTGTPNLNVTEGSNNAHQTVTINVALDRPILTNQTLSWSVAGNAINGTDAVSGADFVGGVLPTGTLTLLAGTTTGQITFQIAGDNAIERAEGYQIVLSGTSGLDLSGIAPLAGTIANDDRAVISISALSAQAVEGDTGSTPYQMTVTLDQASFESQTVDWATEFVSGQGHASAADFALGSALSGSVTFAAGETSKTITLNVAGDTIKEGNESFSVRLSNSMGDATISPINGVLSAAIKDDDGFDVGGHVYFWGGGVASKQFVMDDVDVSVQQLLAGSVQTLIDTPIKMQNIKLNTDSHLATADLWLEHTDVTSFSFTSSSSLPAGAVFTKSPLSNWNVVQTIDENGLLHVSGNYTGAVGTQTLDAMKIGVMSFVTPAEDASPLSFKLLDGSVSNDAGFSKTISPVEAKITFADTTDVSSPGDMLDGQYTLGTLTEGFYGIDADRDFTLSTKDANGFDIWSNEVRAITAADARACLLISQGKQVSAHELIAADVNGSGTVTAADARDILLMSIKNTTKLTTELEWKFVDEDADLSALTKNNVKEGVAWKQGADISVTSDSSHNLVGILMGDLNASYTPDYAKVTPDQAYIW